MTKILISPSKYIQGPGELKKLGAYAAPYGTNVMLLISKGGYQRVGEMVTESFQNTGCSITFSYFHGECCRSEIDRLTKCMREKGCSLMIGIGGGKIFDTAKAAAFYADTPVIICPTAASTDAPCSASAIIYTENGVHEQSLHLRANPNLVIMDTEIIAKSPVRLTVAGMGDALSTYFEARACQRSQTVCGCGGISTDAAMALARLCYDTLLKEGWKAKTALEAGACTEAVEKIIEANTLLSGIGFESAGLAAAHAVHNGLTVLEECRQMYHGEKVAFGTIVQLVLENAPIEELEQVIRFCIKVGLPVTLGELGLKEITDEKILAVSKAACTENSIIHHMPFSVTAASTADAIKAADAYGRSFLCLQAP